MNGISRSRTTVISSILAVFLLIGIFVSCHPIDAAESHSSGDFQGAEITQSINVPCCMTGLSSFSLHHLPLVKASQNISSQNAAFNIVYKTVHIIDSNQESEHYNKFLYYNRISRIFPSNHLNVFITNGLLQPKVSPPDEISA